VKGDVGAYINYMERALPDLVTRLVNGMDRQMIGYGYGVKARVASVGAYGAPAAGQFNVVMTDTLGISGWTDPWLQFLEQERNVFTGNQVTRNISAKFNDKKSLQKFLAQVPAGEEIRLSGISPSLSTQKAVEAELLDAAVIDVKKQAETLLGKFGLKIIGIHSISQDAPSVGFEAKAMYRSMDVAAAPPPPLGDTLEEGQIMVSKDVYVVYLIAAK
jgi:hypothetical protein